MASGPQWTCVGLRDYSLQGTTTVYEYKNLAGLLWGVGYAA